MFLYSPCLSNCFWVKKNLQLTHSDIFKCPYFPILDVAWKQPLALWDQVLWRMEPLLPPAYSQGQSHSGIWWCRVMTAFISCHVCLLPNGEMTVSKVNRQLVWKVKYGEAFNPSRQEPVLDFSATACHVHDSGLRPMKPGYVQERQELDSEHSQKLSGHKCQFLDRHTAKPMRLFLLDILRNCLCNIPTFLFIHRFARTQKIQVWFSHQCQSSTFGLSDIPVLGSCTVPAPASQCPRDEVNNLPNFLVTKSRVIF